MPAAAIDPQLAFFDVTQTVRSISDAALATSVQRASVPRSVNLSPKIALASIPTFNRSLTLAPDDLLAELAEASCPPLISSGLRDLTLRWSWLRYCWAFEQAAAGAAMRPSMAAIGLVNHHRTLASEQLGIAMALAVARRYLRDLHQARAVMFLDVDVALTGSGSGMLGVSQVPGSRMRPDYFALVDGSRARSLTCRGCFCTRSSARARSPRSTTGSSRKRPARCRRSVTASAARHRPCCSPPAC